MGMGCLYKTCSFTQQTEPKTLRNRKPETMGSGEAPRSMGVMTAAQDAADMGSRNVTLSWTKKPKRAGRNFLQSIALYVEATV